MIHAPRLLVSAGELCQGRAVEPRATCVFAVTGSVAAYKAPLVVRALLARGVRVVPIATRSALEFVGRETLSGLTGEQLRVDMFGHAGELHVELGALADVVAVVPATADVLARLASGRADDLVTATCLCARGRVVVAPAMHPRMWEHPATQRNVEVLRADGRVHLVGPEHGPVASGDVGMGRLADLDAITEAISGALERRDLEGVRLLVTAGPTHEDVDPVRFLGNRSSGKMGFAIARRAAARGARVTLVTGPVALPTPPLVRRVDVRSALEMQRALDAELGADLRGADAVVMSAAVADYRPSAVSAEKRKRTSAHVTLDLAPNPDLIGAIGARRAEIGASRPVLVAFAVETEDDGGLVAAARKKLASKRVDLVVANSAAESLGLDESRVALVTAAEAPFFGPRPKSEIADVVLDSLGGLLRS